jgi:hypothetical protein
MPDHDRDTYLDLPLFDGFPYWVTRVASGVYHITLLPPVPTAMLIEATQRQATINQLPTCLVLAEHHAHYVDASGHTHTSQEPPRGGIIFTGGLAPVLRGDAASQDLRLRTQRLATLIDGLPDGGVFGDLTKGGRPATADDLARLGGLQSDGTPKGLHRCGVCGDWAGTCLDPSEVFAGQVMTVHCRCDNHNRCARCGGLLHERRLNANYYNPQNRSIWHVPGFVAFGHRCQRPRHDSHEDRSS